MWLNTMVQTIYDQDVKSKTDYPYISNKCIVFAEEFYNIMKGKWQILWHTFV